MIRDKGLRDCAAVASDLAAKTFGLEVLARNIEDDDVNFTRFLLLSREPAGVHLPPSVPAKTSVVFTVADVPGALYKALACFSLRDVDFSKIESRPTSPILLQYLRYRHLQDGGSGSGGMVSGGGGMGGGAVAADLPRFQYCFYLDFLAAELDDAAQSALSHLRDFAPFVRVLGSYPRKGTLVGPVRDTIDALSRQREAAATAARSAALAAGTAALPAGAAAGTATGTATTGGPQRLKIGIVGFGKFGQFIARTLAKHADLVVMSRTDQSAAAKAVGARGYLSFEAAEFFANEMDVVVFAVSILSFEEVLRALPADALRGKLVVDVLSVKVHAKKVMLELLPASADVLCTHPMFGPESGKDGWHGLPFLYDKV
ncbi:unnamed protein product, partial [Phaeothamnion confervicola]